MSTNLGALVMKLVLEARQFRQDLSKEVSQTEAAVGRLEKSTTSMGGAVKDIVESQSTAAAAASRSIAVLGTAGAAAALAVGAATYAHMQGAKEAQAYERSITLTGNAAGVTVGQLGDMARAVDRVVGTQGQAAATLAQMAGTGRIAGENLQKFTITAQEMERSAGTAVGDTVKVFAELGEAPVKASLKLNETMNYLTASTYAQIKAAMELGDEERAASLAQNAYADAMGPRIARIEGSLGTLEKAWRGVKGVAKEAWDAMLNIGREASVDQKLNILREELERRTQRGVLPGRSGESFERGNEELRQKIAFLTEQVRLETRATEARTESERIERKRIELAQALEASASKQEKMAIAIARANQLADAAGATQAERDQLVAAAKEKYAERTARATRQAATEQERMAKAGEALAESLTAQSSGLSGDFLKKWEQLNAAYAAGDISLQKLTDSQAALLSQQPAMKTALDAQTKSASELAKTMDAYAKANAAGVAEGVRAAQQAEDQLAHYGLLKSEVQELTLTYLEQSRESAALAGEDVSNIEARIKAQKRLLAATRGIEQRQSSDQAATAAAAEWQKTADSINSSLTDALLRGFESGKDFAENLRDTVVNMFKTMILRPVISAIISPISGAILGGMGLAGSAAAGQGGGGGTLSTVASGASLFGSFGGAMAGGAGWLTGATTLGGSLSAGASLIGTGTLAGAGAGVGMMAGALAPLVLGVMALSSLFSRKLKDSGIEGTFGGESGFEGRSYKFYKGGLFRSDKTEYDELDEQVRKTLGDTFKAMSQQVSDFADVLGLSTERLAGFTSDIKLSTHGLSEGDAQKKLQEALDTANNELAQQVIGTWEETTETIKRRVASSGVEMDAGADAFREVEETVTRTTYKASEFAREGEKAIDTLTRLATSLTLANTWFKRFGASLFDASLEGGDKASSFVDSMGGKEAFDQRAGSYFNNFYSSNQRRTAMRSEIEDRLSKAGIEMPRTAAEFKAAMDGFLAMGEAGHEGAAALFEVSDAFAEVNGSVGDLEQAMGISADSLKGILDDVRKNATSAAEAKKMASQKFEDSIYDGLGSAMTQGLSQMIMSAVVGPLLDGLLAGATGSATVMVAGGVAGGSGVAAGGAAAGSSVAAGGAAAGAAMAQGGAVAGAAVASTVEQARAYMAAFADIMNDPAVRDTISQIADGFGDIAGDMFGLTGSMGGASAAMASTGSAAGAMGDSISDLGDSIEAEIKRLRGLMVDDSPGKGKDFLLAEFTTATAAARAGDQSALERLPELSQKIEEATRLTAGSSVELARMRGWLAGSLSGTNAVFASSKSGAGRPAAIDWADPSKTPTYVNGVPTYTPREVANADSRYASWRDNDPIAGTGTWVGFDPNWRPDWRYASSMDTTPYLANPIDGFELTFEDWWAHRNDSSMYYGIPKYLQGTNYVPEDGLAYLHKGEAVVPEKYNRAAVAPSRLMGKAGAQDAVVQELRALRTDVGALRTQQRDETLAQQRINLRTVKVLERWERSGMPDPRNEGVAA